LLAQQAGYNASLVQAQPGRLLGLGARRPTYSALASERGSLLPPLEDAVGRYLAETVSSKRAEVVNALAQRAGR